MGLDMYALTKPETPDSPVDFEEGDATELHYWRKHPNLHGWMERLYRDKGGDSDSFNAGNTVLLSVDDLDQLEADIKANRLPHTEGFFFGVSDGMESADDLTFIGKARTALSAGLTVFYTSWW